jgi:Ni/Co efflux regulator RcnB
MKRIATMAVATLVAMGPIAATGASAQDFRRGDRGDSGDYDRRDGDRDRDRSDRGDDDRRDGDRYDRRDGDRRDGDRYDRRDNDRDWRSSRWHSRRHNGYWVNGRWYYGPPPAWAQDRRDFRADYRQWRRGERLPSYYRSHYRQVDWRRERLRQPPRGYQYVRDDDRGETLLVGIATGVILGIILSNN